MLILSLYYPCYELNMISFVDNVRAPGKEFETGYTPTRVRQPPWRCQFRSSVSRDSQLGWSVLVACHVLLGLLDDAIAIGYFHHVMLLDVVGVSASQALKQIRVSGSKIIRLGRIDA